MTKPLAELIQARQYDEALRRIDSGELDPAAEHGTLYFVVGLRRPASRQPKIALSTGDSQKPTGPTGTSRKG